MKEQSEKAGLNLSIKKMKIMASGPINSWQINGEKKWKQLQTLFSWIPKSLWTMTAAMRLKTLRRKAMTNLDSIFKSKDITLPANVSIVKAKAFPLLMY